MPYFFRKDDDKYCVYKGTPKEPEELIKCHATPDLAQKHVAALMSATAHEDKDFRSSFTVKRQANGSFRWLAISSVAIEDKEGETISEKAYDDAIELASRSQDYGDLDLVHIDGTSVGDCDMMVRLGPLLVEGGAMRDTPRAKGVIEAVEEDPDYWGVSIRFVPDPEQFDEQTKTYRGGIRILNRTILPRWMAASHGTAISVKGGTTMKLDKDAREALVRMKLSDEDIGEIEALVQQKSADPNVVVKADEAADSVEGEPVEPKEVEEKSVEAPEPEETSEVEPGVFDAFIKRLTDLLPRRREPVEQAEKADESASTEVDAPEVSPVDYDEITKRVMAPVQEATVEAVNKQLEALTPLFGAIADGLEAMNKRVEALEGPVEDLVEKKLRELPPVVKVSAQTLQADPAVVEIAGEGAPTAKSDGPYAALMNQITTSVANAVGRPREQAKIEV